MRGRLKLGFNIDITTCEASGGTVKVIPKAFAVLTWQALASIEDPAVIKQVLAHLEKKAESKEFKPFPESRAPPHHSRRFRRRGLFG